MERVSFKKSGILYLLHKIMFSKDPSDTCAYKRELIISTIVFLVTLHASILRCIFWLFPENREDKDLFGIKGQFIAGLLALFSLMAGHGIIEKSFIVNDFVFWSELSLLELYLYSFVAMGIGSITIAIGIGVITLVCYLLYLLFKVGEKGFNVIKDVAPPLTNDEGEPTTQIGVVYQSAKERWCKKIDWER